MPATPTDRDQLTALETSELDLATLLDRGMELCRSNQWQEGIAYLAAVVNVQPRPSALPSQFYGLLGHGLVRVQRKEKEGVALCRRAVREGFGEVENHILLVRTLWMARRRAEAFKALDEGLRLATQPDELEALGREIDRRRPPTISAISRDHIANRFLGKLTYRA